MVPPVVLSGVPSSVGSPAPGGLLLPYTKLPGSVLPRHSRGCLGSLNPRASSAFCSQPSYSLSHPFSPFFFKTIVCVPPSPPPAIVFVDDLTRSHQKPHTENQQRGICVGCGAKTINTAHPGASPLDGSGVCPRKNPHSQLLPAPLVAPLVLPPGGGPTGPRRRV